MTLHTIGIGEWKVSSDPADILKTYALGSCVAVIIYDKLLRVGGMIHVALPEAGINREKAMTHPGYFADVGLPLMIEEMKAKGVQRHNLWVKLAGGSQTMDPEGLFDIGKRNLLAVKKILWKSMLGPVAEEVGGNISRTVSLNIETGEVEISTGNQKKTI